MSHRLSWRALTVAVLGALPFVTHATHCNGGCDVCDAITVTDSSKIGNGVCDRGEYNVWPCFDGGDCCQETHGDGTDPTCGGVGCYCLGNTYGDVCAQMGGNDNIHCSTLSSSGRCRIFDDTTSVGGYSFQCQCGVTGGINNCPADWTGKWSISGYDYYSLLPTGAMRMVPHGPHDLVEVMSDPDEPSDWGGVCDSGWSDFDGQVLCQEMGYAGVVGTEDALAAGSSQTGPSYSYGNYWPKYTAVTCGGSEVSMHDCSATTPAPAACTTSTLAGVECTLPVTALKATMGRPTVTVETACRYLDSSWDLSRIRDGICDAEYNTHPCFDGGDCCQSTCTGPNCGINGYACKADLYRDRCSDYVGQCDRQVATDTTTKCRLHRDAGPAPTDAWVNDGYYEAYHCEVPTATSCSQLSYSAACSTLTSPCCWMSGSLPVVNAFVMCDNVHLVMESATGSWTSAQQLYVTDCEGNWLAKFKTANGQTRATEDICQVANNNYAWSSGIKVWVEGASSGSDLTWAIFDHGEVASSSGGADPDFTELLRGGSTHADIASAASLNCAVTPSPSPSLSTGGEDDDCGYPMCPTGTSLYIGVVFLGGASCGIVICFLQTQCDILGIKRRRRKKMAEEELKAQELGDMKEEFLEEEEVDEEEYQRRERERLQAEADAAQKRAMERLAAIAGPSGQGQVAGEGGEEIESTVITEVPVAPAAAPMEPPEPPKRKQSRRKSKKKQSAFIMPDDAMSEATSMTGMSQMPAGEDPDAPVEAPVRQSARPSLKIDTQNAAFTRQQTLKRAAELKKSAWEEGMSEDEHPAAQLIPSQGYDVSRFEKEEEELRHFVCAVCHDVVMDPVEAPCGHLYCKICMEQTIQLTGECPQCRYILREEDVEIPHLFFRQAYGELRIHCKYQQAGCPSICDLSTINAHESTCTYIIDDN